MLQHSGGDESLKQNAEIIVPRTSLLLRNPKNRPRKSVRGCPGSGLKQAPWGSQHNLVPESRSLRKSCRTSESGMACARRMINRTAVPDGECLRGASDFFPLFFLGNLNLQLSVAHRQKTFASPSHARASRRRGAEFTPTHRINNTFSELEKMTGKRAVNPV